MGVWAGMLMSGSAYVNPCDVAPTLSSITASTIMKACSSPPDIQGVANLSGSLGTDFELYWWYDVGAGWVAWGAETTGTIVQYAGGSCYLTGTATTSCNSPQSRFKAVVRLISDSRECGSQVTSSYTQDAGETGACQ